MKLLAAALVALTGLAGAAGAARADDDEVAPTLTCKRMAPGARLAVSFGADVSIGELATWVAGFTCDSVVLAPDVTRHATRLNVIVPRTLTVREAVKLFVNTLEASGLEVRRKDRTFLVSLGPRLPRGCPDVTLPPPGAEAPPPTGTLPLDAERLADKVAASIRKVAADHVEVPRAVVDQLVANPAAFARGARVVPAVQAGKVIGFKLYAVRPGSVFAKVGLANGDTVTAIDGRPLDSVEQAVDAYTALRRAERMVLTVVRRGAPLTLTITIVP